MRSSDVVPDHFYLSLSGNSFRYVKSIEGNRVFWRNDITIHKSCSKSDFARACSREIELDELIKRNEFSLDWFFKEA